MKKTGLPVVLLFSIYLFNSSFIKCELSFNENIYFKNLYFFKVFKCFIKLRLVPKIKFPFLFFKFVERYGPRSLGMFLNLRKGKNPLKTFSSFPKFENTKFRSLNERKSCLTGTLSRS